MTPNLSTSSNWGLIAPLQPGVIEPLDEHALLILLVQLFLLLAVARGLGEGAKRLGLPAVVGELLAGIVLGPSLFGALAPGLFTAIFPQLAGSYHLIEVVSWIGLLMLLIVTGFETDLDLIASRARPAALVSAAGIVVPFGMGFGLGYALPETFLAGGDRFVFSLFIATAMSISAIPVIAKVLIDMDAIHRDVGQITIAAGMIDDTIGWILLSIVAALASATAAGGESSILAATGRTILFLLVFLGLAFTVGRRAAEYAVRWADTTIGGEGGKITVLMVAALGVGAITQYIGVEAVLGAFVVGLLVGQVKRFDEGTRHTFETITLSVFAPIFFAMAGLRVDLTTLADPTLAGAGVVVLAVATIGKFTGAFVGAKAAGLSRWEGLAMGSGMNARGAIEIIVATIGLSIGVLSVGMYSIIVLVAVVTSLTAPPLLRATLSRIPLSEEEAARLNRRETEQRSFLGRTKRVLLPTQCGADSLVAAGLLGHTVRRRDIDVTCLYVDQIGEPRRTETLLQRLRRVVSGADRTPNRLRGDGAGNTDARQSGTRSPEGCLDSIRAHLGLDDARQSSGTVSTTTRFAGESVSETVLGEARNRYDLLVLGMSGTAQETDRSLFGADIDRMLQLAPCPIMAVRSNLDTDDRATEELPVRRILLPTVGTQYSRHAAEVACAIGADRGAIVEIMHVVNRPQADEFLYEPSISEALALGEEIVDREAALGRSMGAEVLTHVTVGDRPEREILTRATEIDADLIVMGSEIRPTSRRAFLGRSVEQVSEHASCPVAVVSSV